jgi:hypothetical protein
MQLITHNFPIIATIIFNNLKSNIPTNFKHDVLIICLKYIYKHNQISLTYYQLRKSMKFLNKYPSLH